MNYVEVSKFELAGYRYPSAIENENIRKYMTKMYRKLCVSEIFLFIFILLPTICLPISLSEYIDGFNLKFIMACILCLGFFISFIFVLKYIKENKEVNNDIININYSVMPIQIVSIKHYQKNPNFCLIKVCNQCGQATKEFISVRTSIVKDYNDKKFNFLLLMKCRDRYEIFGPGGI